MKCSSCNLQKRLIFFGWLGKGEKQGDQLEDGLDNKTVSSSGGAEKRSDSLLVFLDQF